MKGTESLLSPNLGDDRDQMLANLGIGYSARLGQPMANYAIWKKAQDALVTTIKQRYADMGLEAAPFMEDSLWKRIDLDAMSPDPIGHMRLFRALLTDYTQRFWAQFPYRRKHGGNVHGQVVGPTGMGKTTCVGTIAHVNRPIPEGQLLRHVAIDPGDLPDRFKGKVPGDTVWLDELLAQSGQGSLTISHMLGNIDDTMRASGVDFWTASPELETTSATQVQLEVILWSPPAVIVHTDNEGKQTNHYFCRKCGIPWTSGYCSCGWHPWSFFLVWVKGIPHGVIGIRWMPEHLWREYSPWKAGNVERTMKAMFRDRSYTAKQALKLLTDPGVVKYLTTFNDQKPRLGDFEDVVLDKAEGMMTTDQAKRIAQLMMRMCLKFTRLAPMFEELYGVPPPDQLKQLAALWEGGEL